MFNYTQYDPTQCEFIVVASVEDLPNGERMFIEIDHETIVVFNVAGQYFAIADLCSHDSGPVGDGDLEENHLISCPRHGGRFDIRNGKAVAFPAVEDIPAYPVRVVEGELQIGLPLQAQ